MRLTIVIFGYIICDLFWLMNMKQQTNIAKDKYAETETHTPIYYLRLYLVCHLFKDITCTSVTICVPC